MRSINQIGANQAERTVPLPQAASLRAGVYMRVSTREQADKWSLATQRSILTAYAERMGWAVRIYDEGAASGETIADRPEMQRLLDDAEAGRIDIVLVIEWERLSRASDLTDQARITSTCRRAGVRIATPERTYDLRLAEDDFESDLHGILSKREKRKLLERTKRGLDAAKDAGKFAGGQPMLGYRYDHATRKIIVDPETVPLVQRIFESDLSEWQLYRQFKREGIDVWYEKIRRIRTHPWYLGKRVNSAGNLIAADWPALVDETTWNRWQKKAARLARRSPRPSGPTYLLSAMVRCNACRGPVVGRPTPPAKDGTPLFAYQCHEESRPDGSHGRISGWLVDLVVVQTLTQYARDPKALRAHYRNAVEAAAPADVAAARAQLTADMADLEDRETRLLDAVERGVIPDAAAQRRMKRIDASRKLLQSREEALSVAERVATLPSLELILAAAERLPEGDRDGTRKLLEMLAQAIVLDFRERTVLIQWRLGGEARVPIPRLRGGPGRSVASMRRTALRQLPARP